MSNVTSLVKSFRDYVESHRCGRDTMTHTTLGPPKGLYRFSGKDYQDFMSKYSQIVMSDANIDLYFVERPNSNGVTFLFLDLDFDHKQKRRHYTKDHITSVIDITNEFLRENFEVTEYQLTTFVTEKPKPTKRNKTTYKDGFHVYYPYLPMEEKHRYFVLDYLVPLAEELLGDIPYINDTEKIFDMSIVKSNGILMYESKKEGGNPYALTHVYSSDLENLGTDGYDKEELIYLLSNQRFDAEGAVDAIDDADTIKQIDTIYNQYNGGHKKNNKKNNKQNNNQQILKDKIDRNSKNSSKNNRKKTVEEQRDIEMVRKLIGIMNKKRATDFKSWRRVGFALYAVDDSLYNSFVEFSKKNISKYNESKVTCEDIWNAAPGYIQFYSIAAIRHWARLDNEKEYYKIVRKMNDSVFGKAETSKHVDIAQVVYELYKDRFVCIDIQKKKWYEFQDHRWVVVQSAYTLEELISDEVRKMMTMYCTEKLSETMRNNDGFDHDINYKKYHKLMGTIENLGDVKFRENVVRACANKFFSKDFQSKLDDNLYLIGFSNGVYDLKEMCFRDGLPNDYLSMTVGYEYIKYKGTELVFEKIDKFFKEIQTEKDMREYIFTFIASVLRGQPDQKVHIWTGGGGNGKSALVDLIKNMLGDYFGVLPVTILTRKRGSSSSATPELADKFGKRFLVIQEPEHNDVVYVGQMKEYSGKDTILARPLYGDPFYYIPQFTMVLTCNNLPHIPASDDGTWRRLRVTPYESQFVEQNPVGPKQFLIDEELQEEFPSWAQPLMWLIVNKYYPIYEKGLKGRKYKITEPDKVKLYTKNYKMDSDVYMEFLEENLITTNNDGDTENIAFLFETFRDWYSASYTEKPPPKKSFMSYLKKKKYKMDKQKIFGVKYALGLN